MSEAVADRVELEPPGPLARSQLWELQGRWYERQGVASWNTGKVPHHITNSPITAEAYVDMVAAYIDDLDAAGRLDLARPFPVVELGAGSGRFGFQFLRLWARRVAGSSRPLPPIRYVMTDLCSSNLEHLRAHPRLTQYLETGTLEFAQFDVRTLQPAVLTEGGPMALVANYVFDSLPQDAFVIRGGQLHESLIRVTVPSDIGIDHPDVLSFVQIEWDTGPAVPTAALVDERLSSVLPHYQDRLPDTRFLIPIAAFDCLRHFQHASGGELFVLFADKGELHEWHLQAGDAPKVELHGSFSLPVNFHALGRYAEGLGAEVFAPSNAPEHLVVVAYAFGPPAMSHASLGHTFHSIIGRRGPDEVCEALDALCPNRDPEDIGAALALLRLTNHDPAEFSAMMPALVALGGSIPDWTRAEVHRALLAVWDGYFAIGEPDDVAFAIGAVLCSMGYHAEAIGFYDRSVDLLGPEPGVLFSRALCRFHLRRLDDALKGMDAVLGIDPGFSPARSIRAAISAELDVGDPSW